jgi:hypothetical protein
MTLFKSLWGAFILFAMVACQPAYSLPQATQKIRLTNNVCSMVSAHVSDTIKLVKDGRTNIEIMSWLDKVTPDPKQNEPGYLAVVMSKLLITDVRNSMAKAFRAETIIKRQKEDCLANLNSTIKVY